MPDCRPSTRCLVCGRAFVPDRYNRHHQVCCGRQDCRRRLKRRRQREWRRTKYATEAAFRARAKAAVTASRRRQRWRAVVLSHRDLALLGLAAQVAGTRTTTAARAFLSQCAELGRRLEAGVGAAAGP